MKHLDIVANMGAGVVAKADAYQKIGLMMVTKIAKMAQMKKVCTYSFVYRKALVIRKMKTLPTTTQWSILLLEGHF